MVSLKHSINSTIRFNHNQDNMTPYALSLGMHSTSTSYVWPKKIDFSIIIISIKYAIGVFTLAITSMKQHRRFVKKLKTNIIEGNQLQIVLRFIVESTYEDLFSHSIENPITIQYKRKDWKHYENPTKFSLIGWQWRLSN